MEKMGRMIVRKNFLLYQSYMKIKFQIWYILNVTIWMGENLLYPAVKCHIHSWKFQKLIPQILKLKLFVRQAKNMRIKQKDGMLSVLILWTIKSSLHVAKILKNRNNRAIQNYYPQFNYGNFQKKIFLNKILLRMKEKDKKLQIMKTSKKI
jgi:hypothetical protein